MNKKSKVILLPCNSYREELVYESLELGLELLGGIEGIIDKNESILLKPNLLRICTVRQVHFHIRCITEPLSLK